MLFSLNLKQDLSLAGQVYLNPSLTNQIQYHFTPLIDHLCLSHIQSSQNVRPQLESIAIMQSWLISEKLCDAALRHCNRNYLAKLVESHHLDGTVKSSRCKAHKSLGMSCTYKYAEMIYPVKYCSFLFSFFRLLTLHDILGSNPLKLNLTGRGWSATQPFGYAQGHEHVEWQMDFLRVHQLYIIKIDHDGWFILLCFFIEYVHILMRYIISELQRYCPDPPSGHHLRRCLRSLFPVAYCSIRLTRRSSAPCI